MAKNKTNATTQSVDAFISKIANEVKRDDSYKLIKIFSSLTGFEAVMWGPSIIGFGAIHYKYDSGHEGDMPLAAFSPRSTALVIYFFSSIENREALLKKLGKFKGLKGCIYIKKLEDIDTGILGKIVAASIKAVKKKYS